MEPLIDFKDLAGISKPLTKLIEVISTGIGKASNPILICLNAKALAYKVKELSNAIDQAKGTSSTPLAIEYADETLKIIGNEQQRQHNDPVEDFFQRIESRTSFQETKKQRNLDSIILNATEEIQHSRDASDQAVDPDWIDRFFDKAQHISNVTMQKIWGRILAGETVSPGRFSLRALDILSNLKLEEADLFRKASCYAIAGGIFVEPLQDKITFEEFLLLKDLILISPGSSLGMTYTIVPGHEIHLTYLNKVIFISCPSQKTLRLKFEKFTRIGLELLNLTDSEIDTEYLNGMIDTIKSNGLNCSLADIQSIEGDFINIINKTPI